jgi:hypothetical protein
MKKARLVSLLFVFAAIAMFIGGLPWGGNTFR